MASKPLGVKREHDENTHTSASSVRPKKTRTALTNTTATTPAALVDAILANPKTYPIDANQLEGVRRSLVELAGYPRALQQQLAVLGGHVACENTSTQTVKSPEERKAEAEKLRRAAQNGIIKQMGWKPTCKTGRAKWCYEGFCPDPEVFGVLLGLDGPPKFKIKKFRTADFEKLIGELRGPVRYATLYVTSSEVAAHWSDSGEFKFSGLYGKPPPYKG